MHDTLFAMLPLSPWQAAEALVAAFSDAARAARPLGSTCAAVSAAIGAPVDAADEAVHRASLTIARAVDEQQTFFDRHPYHNRQHFCEVVLTAHFLCRLHGLPPRDARRVLLAATVHDLEHDGAPGPAFAYERRSVARGVPFLARAGVDETEYQALAALVVATDPRQGVLSAQQIQQWHKDGQGPALSVLPAPEMQALVDDPALARAAAILCEADVLPSVGLSVPHALKLQERLAREWGCTLEPADKARFIDEVVGAGVIGEFFLPNVLEIRRALLAPAHVAPC